MVKIKAVDNGYKKCALSHQRGARLRWASSGLALTLAVLLAGCGGGGSVGGGQTTTQVFDFNQGMQGWSSDVSDLPANYNNGPDGFDISYSVAPLPSPLDTTKKALRLTSSNRSDDLWQFLKRRITGLKANSRYMVRFDVEIASDAPQNSVGIGGSPGSSVFVKVGAATQEPKVEIQEGERVFTLDKGNNAQEGTQGRNIGTVVFPARTLSTNSSNSTTGLVSFRSAPTARATCGFMWAPIQALRGVKRSTIPTSS